MASECQMNACQTLYKKSPYSLLTGGLLGRRLFTRKLSHYDDVTVSGMASQITRFTIVYSTVYPGADQRKHQSPASLAFVRGIHRGPVNSRHKWPVTWKLFPFDDIIMECRMFNLDNTRRHYKSISVITVDFLFILSYVYIGGSPMCVSAIFCRFPYVFHAYVFYALKRRVKWTLLWPLTWHFWTLGPAEMW